MYLHFIHVYQLYFETYYTGKKPSNSEVEQLLNLAEKYTLANHLFWGLWGLISVCYAFPFFEKCFHPLSQISVFISAKM